MIPYPYYGTKAENRFVPGYATNPGCLEKSHRRSYAVSKIY